MVSISKLLAFLTSLLMVFSPMALAQNEPAETTQDAGITPDSFLWGLDRAIEQIELLLTTSPGDKARVRLEHAHERLLEVKIMIEENRLDAAQRAQAEHGEELDDVEEFIQEIEEDDALDEIEEEIEVEKEWMMHKERIQNLSGELKIKIKVRGNLTAEQQALIDSILASMEGKAGEVKITIDNAKGETKIKIKQQTGKSDEEIDDDIDELEEEVGVQEIEVKAEIMGNQAQIKVEREFTTSTTDRIALIQEIIESFALDRETADSLLEIEVEEEGEEIDEKFEVEVDTEEGFSDVKVELKFALNSTGREAILDAIVEMTQLTAEEIEAVLDLDAEELDEEEELEIEVEIEDGIAEVKVKANGEKMEFTLNTTDRDAIADQIAARTGLTREEVDAVIEFETEDETEEEDKEKLEEEDEEDDSEEAEDDGEADDEEDRSGSNSGSG